MTRFESPYFLLLLPTIILIFKRSKSSGSVRYSKVGFLKKVYRKKKDKRIVYKIIYAFALTSLIFALARPQSGKTFRKATSEGVDIYLILDTSRSMIAMDFEIDNKRKNRLSVVKNVVQEFVEQRKGDRIGLVVFGTDAFTQCPLTTDYRILNDFINSIEIGMVGDATAIGNGLGVALKRMKDMQSKSKIAILLTDGVNTEGSIDPIGVAQLAKNMGVKVYTIGVGTRGRAPFLVDNGIFGKRFIYRDVELDEDTLKEIASVTSGEYYRATDTEELKNIYKDIDKLEKTKVEVNQFTEYTDYFPILLGLSFGLFLLGMFLEFYIFPTVP